MSEYGRDSSVREACFDEDSFSEGFDVGDESFENGGLDIVSRGRKGV